jgi:translocation and assembly module TamA
MLVCFGCATTDHLEGIAYKVVIQGAGDRAVKKAVKDTATTITMRRRPPSTLGQLRRRMEKDISRIEAILESRGYHDGQVALELDPEQSPPRVYIRIDLGEQYRFRDVHLRFAGEPDEKLQDINPMIRRHNRAVAATVFAEQQRILDLMKRRGYPFPELDRRTVSVDREHKMVDLDLVFDPGALAYFGPMVVVGLERLKPTYIERQIPWSEGRRYDSQMVREFQNRLLGSGLFGSAQVSPLEPIAETNAIPISVAVKERDQKTIRLGVNYSDVGPGASIYWEHRSLFGGGDRFETSVSWNPVETEAEGKLTRPGFLAANQSLVLNLTATVETPDAYDSTQTSLGGMLLRDFTSKIQGGGGLGYKYSRVDQLGSSDRHAFVLFPALGILDYRDDRLNPLRGYQLFGRTTWFQDTMGTDSFLKSYLEGCDYSLLWDKYRLSSALRLTLGSINGCSLAAVPADERYYAGGGGSIRGYEYQSVGPKVDDTPTGGDNLLEFSAELRLQPGNRMGYVAFIDGGTVYNDLPNDSNRSLRYGAGIGIRWFTSIGPLRADLALPLNPDDSQVDRIQFYISLGQAF